MTDYATLVTEDRRLVILRLLAEARGYALNESVLRAALASLAHAVSRDQVRTDLAWLAEQGLVRVETVQEAVQVAALTDRGADAAAGRVVVPGVKRPGPGT